MSTRIKKRKSAKYSPVKEMVMFKKVIQSKPIQNTHVRLTPLDRCPNARINNLHDNHEWFPSTKQQADGTYRAHFKMIDDEHGNGHIDSSFNHCSPKLNESASFYQPEARDQDVQKRTPSPRLDERNNFDNTDQPQDVYICNCCWFSKELEPAYQHLGALSSLFFLFNFFVFAFGLACLGMGLWLRIDPKIYEIHKFIETQNFTYAGWIILFGGFLSCLIAIMGFVGAGKQSQCLLFLYMLIILTLSVAFIGSLVLMIVHGLGMKLELFLNKEIYEQMRRRTMSNQNDWAAQFMDFIQVKMRCCGAVDFTDYAKLGLVVPTTCYTIEKNYINAPGCGRAIRDLLDIRAGLAVGFLAGSIISQLLALILAMIIFCSIYQWRTRYAASPDQGRPITPIEHGIQSTPKTVAELATIGCTNDRYLEQQHDPTSARRHYLATQRPRSRTPIVM